ncbi:hypothetical protein B0H13DRAFT_1877147 [Mycena leptocephala]|nr:hypothetical protein B0H13DRAFT_1877147 [Mycena leptocephala]
MPPPPTVTQIRLNNITTCLTVAMNTLKVLADSVKTPFLVAISSTAMSLLNNIQTLRQSKNECIHLMEQTNKLLSAIIVIHIKSDTVAELSPDVLSQIGKFTETLYKIHTFVEAQQHGSKIKKFFRQGETSTLLKECKAGLQQGLDFFQINTVNIMTDATVMQEEAEKRHQEVLNMIEALSDSTSSDGASFISRVYCGSHNSSNSISMLPSQPKIFHGREAELSEILQLFSRTTPRISILGAEITARYDQDRYFVACDSASTKVELASLIGEHLGLKRGKDLTQAVIKHFSGCPPTLLILDNLETLWEPAESRVDIEEFLSLLTEVKDLALVTSKGAVDSAIVPPLKPWHQEAARQTFVDIADNGHSPEEMDKVLSLADNMPLL